MTSETEAKKPTPEERARLFLKAEIKRANLTYDEVVERLAREGLKESPATIANKLARGTFSATFFIAIAKVIGLKQIDIEGL